jgi:hypothetical protein
VLKPGLLSAPCSGISTRIKWMNLAAGGYLALVKVVKVCLRNATEHMLAFDGRVTKVEFTESNAK